MPRPLSLAAVLFFAGCGSSSDSTPTEQASEELEAKAPEASAPCRADDVATLAKRLARADPMTRRDAVVGLKEVCVLPEEISAFLDADDLAPKPEPALVASLCEGKEAVIAEVESLAPVARAKALFDECGLAQLGLVERDAWLRTSPTTVMPFATMAWLEAQSIPESDAEAIAEAMLLRARRVWGVASQQVPRVGGVLEAVPASAIEVAVTPEAIYVEGAKVLDLIDGEFPDAEGKDAPLDTLERAVLAEREAKGEATDAAIALVADARVRTKSLLPLAGLAPKVGATSLGWVVQSEPLRFGMVRFDVSDRFLPGRPKLGIDASGFTLTPPHGGTQEHVGAEGRAQPYDFEALAKKAKAYAQTKPEGPREVTVDAAEDTPASVLLTAIHHLRGEGCATDRATCWFDTVTVQQGVDPGAIARNAGVLGVLSAEGGAALGSPYASIIGTHTDEDVWGGLTGSDVGEAFGAGGLGLAGTGRGGGGSGEGTIGLGNTGLIGKGSGKKAPRVRQAKPAVKGSLDKDIVRRVVRAHVNEVRFCYRVGLKKDEALAGRVAIDFSIGTTGKVISSQVASTTVDDEAVGTCIAKAVKRWTFPKPPSGGVVIVTYPFVLSPG